MDVLVTGGTGVLGSRVVSRLLDGGHAVRVLSRRANPRVPRGIRAVRGDLDTGEGLRDAAADAEAVVHCATENELPTYRRARRTDVEGTTRLLAAMPEQARLVYISIVGIDRIPLGYYRAKLEAERAIEASGRPYTILRTTRFHDFLFRILSGLSRLPVVPVGRGFAFQPVDSGEVATRMVQLLDGDPPGRVPDMGGPEVLPLERLARSFLEHAGKRRPVVGVPVPGRVGAAFRARHNTCPEQAAGRIGWSDWLSVRRP